MGKLSSLAGGLGWRRVLLAVVGLLVWGVGFFSLSAPAFAEFVRPFQSAVVGTPTGPSGELVPFGKLGCIAIDTGEGGNLSGNWWVRDKGHSVFDEFSSSDAFLKQFSISPSSRTHSCAFDDLSREFVSVGSFEWVAADDSGGPDNGDLYYARSGNPEIEGSVTRTGPEGEPADFTCSAPGSAEYIRNGDELIGKPEWEGEPAESWGPGVRTPVEGVAVDSGSSAFAGDIYVINNKGNHSLEVDVFSSSGCFERAITGTRIVEGKVEELFVGGLFGVAVDPSDGDVLVKGETESSGWVVGEFNPEGELLGELTGRSKEDQLGREDPGGGIAVGVGGDLYVAGDEVTEDEGHVVVSERNVVDVFGPGAYFPGAVTGGVSSVRAGGGAVKLSGVVRGAFNNIKGEDLALSKCYFQFVSEEEFQKSVGEGKGGFSSLVPGGAGYEVPCVFAGGGSPVGERLGERNYEVGAEVGVGGFVRGGVYRYRLVGGTSVVEHGGLKEGEAESFVAPGAPLVVSMSVGGVSSSFADFRAEVDPVGVDTSYWFEYVGGSGVRGETPAVDVGSGDRGVSVVQRVGGLSPGTSYRVRVVARNAAGVTVGVGGSEAYEVFATLPASAVGLPDGRGYELLTPPNKGDAEDMFGVLKDEIFSENLEAGSSAADGGEFLFRSKSEFGSFPASGENFYAFSRGSGGWPFGSGASPALGIQSSAVCGAWS